MWNVDHPAHHPGMFQVFSQTWSHLRRPCCGVAEWVKQQTGLCWNIFRFTLKRSNPYIGTHNICLDGLSQVLWSAPSKRFGDLAAVHATGPCQCLAAPVSLGHVD